MHFSRLLNLWGTFLYKSLSNTRILKWDSQLCSMSTECESIQQGLRKAPFLGPSDTQYPEATVDAVTRLDQAQVMQSTITTLSFLATLKDSMPSSISVPKNSSTQHDGGFRPVNGRESTNDSQRVVCAISPLHGLDVRTRFYVLGYSRGTVFHSEITPRHSPSKVPRPFCLPADEEKQPLLLQVRDNNVL